ncbi:MAG: HEAT repeat domain-containing protein, partial [Planctomycetota bacterium]
MSGLQVTFDHLSHTTNEAAVEVLSGALSTDAPGVRAKAVQALLVRQSEKSAKLLISKWARLDAEHHELVRPAAAWMLPFVSDSLQGPEATIIKGLQVASDLRLTPLIDRMASLAETGKTKEIRNAATNSVSQISDHLGSEARRTRPSTSVRVKCTVRLHESVRRYSLHQNHRLVESFLACSTWADNELRKAFSPESDVATVLVKQLEASENPGVIELLASAIHRRDIPDCVAQVIETRSDAAFRTAFLTALGSNPNATTLNNLRELQGLACCQGGINRLQEVEHQDRPAFLHARSVTTATTPSSENWLDSLAIACRAVLEREHGNHSRSEKTCDLTSAAVSVFQNCAPLPATVWLTAAKIIASDDDYGIENDVRANL